MGQPVPAGGAGAGLRSDAREAREALRAAGALGDFDESLQRIADVFARRFGADLALVCVYGHRPFVVSSPAESAVTAASLFPEAEPDGEVLAVPDDDAATFDDDLGERPSLSAWQRAGYELGMRSAMHVGLRDERKQRMGFVAVMSGDRGAFSPALAAELAGLGELASACIRPALLLRQIARERALLAEESRLLSEAAAAESEEALLGAMAAGLRRALDCDLAVLFVQGAGSAEARLLSAPQDALTQEQWLQARAVLFAPGNAPLLEESADGCRASSDLALTAPTPVEQFFFEAAGIRSLLSAVRSSRLGGLGLGLAAMRAEPGGWSADERAFLARLSRVVEISVERLRRGDLAMAHLADLERQTELLAVGADLLATLSGAEDLEEACTTISIRLREFFGADHVAFGTIHPAESRREILGFSSGAMRREDLPLELPPEDLAAYTKAIRGGTEVFADLAAVRSLNPGTAIALQGGIRSLLRAPFQLSDGVTGLVTVGSREPGRYTEADAERLAGLCHPMGIAIDRVRLLARMAESSEVLAAQTRVLSALGPGATIESAGQVFVDEARRLFQAEHASLAIVRGDRVQVIASAAEGVMAPELQPHPGAVPGLGAAYASLMEGGPHVIGDLQHHSRIPEEEDLLAKGLRSIMRVPIHGADGRFRGVVSVASRRAHAWNDADLSAFVDLARSLGLVTERAALFAAAAERSARVQALVQLLGTFSLSAAPEEVARKFAAQLREYLRADAVLVHAFDQEAGTRRLIALEGDASRFTSRGRLSLEDSTSYRGMLATPAAVYDATAPDLAPPWFREVAEGLRLGSAVAVRLEADGQPVGMVAAGAIASGRLGEAALSLLATVAGPLAMVIERARFVTSLREQTQRAHAVLDILAALGPRDTTEVAGPVANALRAMYGADHCAIGAFEEETVTLVAVDSSLVDWKPGNSISTKAVLGDTPIQSPVVHVYRDLPADSDGVPETTARAREGGMRSTMRVLVGAPAEPLAVVTVGAREPNRFSEADARQLAQIVQPLAVAIGYFRGRQEAERRTERLETTNRILTRLSAGGTAEHLARGFLAECRNLFGARHAVVLTFDHEAGHGQHLAIDTTVPEAANASELPLRQLHAARLIRHPSPQIVADVRFEPGLHGRHHALIAAGLHSVVRAPLVVHDTVRGAVSLWGEGTGRFAVEDAELLGALTRPLALALEKAAALESLGESELKYRSLVAQAEEMIFLFDSRTHRILDANTYTARALGYEPYELTKLRIDEISGTTPEELATNLAATLADGELHISDSKYRRKDGSLIDVDIVASLVGYGGRQAILVLARDVSERKALMRQLVQSQKMDSLGAMAGAVAHDFNNLLTTILGFAGLLKRSPNMDAEERENLALIEDAARRAADLTGRLLSFSRGGLVRFGRVDLRTVVEDTMSLAEPTLHSALAAAVSLPEGPVYVEGDAGQLQQALTNIVLNARDAMPEGGQIGIALAIEGAVAVVTIEDNGPGMDEETRMRIFEPFYTTKPAGSGTGLGMAITYGIIQGHHGDIAVQSQPGKGTTFTISLPLYHDNTPGGPVDIFNAGEGNLVLVVDDDAMVRRTTTATLAELGYNVVEAPGGSTAVEIVRARPDRFSVVLLDLVMPGMTGSETFRALMAIRPDLPVVVCTGYAADSHIDTDVKRRIAGLIQKPFTAERLARALEAAGARPTRVR
jgi:PAS domain S-box-containing protein